MKETTLDSTAPAESEAESTDGSMPRPVLPIRKSSKLDDVCYDIRGPVLEEAHRLEEAGHRVMKLNIGNPAPFGFDVPEEILVDVIRNLPASQGYCDAKGIYAARRAVMQYARQLGIRGIGIDDIFIGNGVSELVMLALQGLLENDDEVLVPAPDFPLWTAAVNLCGARPVHYLCDEAADWAPDLEDLAARVTPRTRALVVINPNNPTGAVYERGVLERMAAFARRHGLVVFADEIYDKIIYDDAEYIPFCHPRGRPARRYLQRPVQVLPRGRVSNRLDDRQRRPTARAGLHRGAEYPGVPGGCARTCPPSMPCRPPWAATSRSGTWSGPAADSSNSATSPGSC